MCSKKICIAVKIYGVTSHKKTLCTSFLKSNAIPRNLSNTLFLTLFSKRRSSSIKRELLWFFNLHSTTSRISIEIRRTSKHRPAAAAVKVESENLLEIKSRKEEEEISFLWKFKEVNWNNGRNSFAWSSPLSAIQIERRVLVRNARRFGRVAQHIVPRAVD